MTLARNTDSLETERLLLRRIEPADFGFYTFDQACWGHGYASEAARRVFDYAKQALRLPRVVSVIHPDNVASLRLARRFALERDGAVQIRGATFHRYVWPAR
jgi:[ribosomal protein S5]-alanine N-acetyltransferase